MSKQYGVRPPMQKQFGVRPEAQNFNPNHDDRGEFASGGGAQGSRLSGNPRRANGPNRGVSGSRPPRAGGGLGFDGPTVQGGYKFGAGERVKITGTGFAHTGKTGRISTASPSGEFFGVVDKAGKNLGIFHHSDLSRVRGG